MATSGRSTDSQTLNIDNDRAPGLVMPIDNRSEHTLNIYLPAQYNYPTPLDIQDTTTIMNLSPHSDSILEFSPAWLEGVAPSDSNPGGNVPIDFTGLALRGRTFSLMVKMIIMAHKLENIRHTLSEPQLPSRELKFVRTISTPLIPPGADPPLLEGILAHTRDWLYRCYRANERFYRSAIQDTLTLILKEGTIDASRIWREACNHVDQLMDGGINHTFVRKLLKMFPPGYWAGLDCFSSLDYDSVPITVETTSGPMQVSELLALEKRSWQEAMVFRHPPCPSDSVGAMDLTVKRSIIILGNENLDTLPLVFRRPVQVNIFPGMDIYKITSSLKLLSQKFDEVSRVLFVFELPLGGSTPTETYRIHLQNLKTMAGICFPNANLIFSPVPIDEGFPSEVKERILFLNRCIRDLWEIVRPLPGDMAAWSGSHVQWKFGMGAKAWSRWRPYLER